MYERVYGMDDYITLTADTKEMDKQIEEIERQSKEHLQVLKEVVENNVNDFMDYLDIINGEMTLDE
jgi:hypothetical protein